MAVRAFTEGVVSVSLGTTIFLTAPASSPASIYMFSVSASGECIVKGADLHGLLSKSRKSARLDYSQARRDRRRVRGGVIKANPWSGALDLYDETFPASLDTRWIAYKHPRLHRGRNPSEVHLICPPPCRHLTFQPY